MLTLGPKRRLREKKTCKTDNKIKVVVKPEKSITNEETRKRVESVSLRLDAIF